MAFKSHRDATGESYEKGKSAEDIFSNTCKKLGLKVEVANSYQEKVEHFDFIITDKREWKVEVKAQKKTNRYDKNFNNDWIWVEFQGITGQEGWLYGSSDVIAFELSDHFLIVSTKMLRDFCEKNVDKSAFVSQAKDAKYKTYRREGRKDSVALIRLNDIKNIPKSTIIRKYGHKTT